MAEKQVVLTDDGQEVQLADYNLLGAVAGLADDRVLAELLRLPAYNSVIVYKAILPYSTRLGSATAPNTSPVVAPTFSANGSIQVNPFRAVVGSRNLPSAAPSPNPTNDTDAVAAWRDIRSAVFTGDATHAAQTIALTPNASGNPRWDLVYAQVSVDVAQNTVVRRVKDPTAGSISTPSVPQYTGSPVVVQVVTGTPGATPALPVLPDDAAGNYCIPLAYVRVVNGFSSGSTVATTDIRSSVTGHDGTTAVSTYRDLAGGARIRPATGNNDTSGAYATRAPFQWSATASHRPPVFMPPDWVGGDEVLVEVDALDASSANWSHNTGDVVDNSIDWRNRVITTDVQVGNNDFANNPLAASATRLPNAAWQTDHQMASTFAADLSPTVTSGSLVATETHGLNGSVASGATVLLYVDMTTGALRIWFNSTAPLARFIYWIRASAPFPNT